jgi:hypothetical protein
MTSNLQQLMSDVQVLRHADSMPVLDNDYARNTLRPVLRRYSDRMLSVHELKQELERTLLLELREQAVRG